MEIKTTIELLDDYDNQTGNPPYPLDNTKWVAVDDILQATWEEIQKFKFENIKTEVKDEN